MVKVLIILGGLGREGITNSVLTYLDAMHKEKFNLHLGVAGVFEPDILDRAKKIGLVIHILPSRNQKPLEYFIALLKLTKINKFNIVHVHGNSATLGIDMFAAKLGGVPVRIAHSRNTSCTHPILDKLMRPLFNVTYTEGFACGEEAGKWLFGNEKFKVIPNGKNIKRFLFNETYRSKLRTMYQGSDRIVIGHVGVFNRQKNHSFLIDVFYELTRKSDKYVLWLMGVDAGTKVEVEEKIKKYQIEDKVIFLGFKEDVEKYLCAMDIMVFPSFYEGLPNVVVEWQISGLPCILSDRITQECCVMDNVYYLSLEMSPAEWANKISSINLNDRTENQDLICNRMSSAGFDINRNVLTLEKLYIQLGANNGVE